MCLAVKISNSYNCSSYGYKILRVRTNAKGERYYCTGLCGASAIPISYDRFSYLPKHDNERYSCSYSRHKYERAFSIFLNEDEAMYVMNRTHEGEIALFRVEFDSVVAWGVTAWAFDDSKGGRYFTNTIIARKCKLVERIKC